MRYSLLIVVLLLASCGAQPPPRSLSEVQQFIGIAERTVSLGQKLEGRAPAEEIQSLTRQLSDTARDLQLRFNRTEQKTSNANRHQEVLAAAEVIACANARAIEILDVEQMPEFTRHYLAMRAMECAAQATAYLGTSHYPDLTDDIGLAAVSAYSVAMAASVRAGLSGHGLLDGFRETNEVIVTKLAPECHRVWIPNLKQWTIDTYYECIAYDGTTARGNDRESVAAEAARSTSRGVATAVLALIGKPQRS
jgi:hypothetical protein